MAESTVARVILEQLGGKRFALMTGSKHFYGNGNTLSMTLVENKSGATRLYITLDQVTDTYSMCFTRLESSDPTSWDPSDWSTIIVAEYNGVYWDQLQEIFTHVTGLYTSL